MVRKEISLKWNCRYNHLYRIVIAFILLLFISTQPFQMVKAFDKGDIPLQVHNAAPLFQDLLTLSISKDGTGTGTVTSSPIGIECGATCAYDFELNTLVTLTAASDTGSTFTGWSDAGCPGTDTCQVTMDVAKGVTATFTSIEYTLTVTSAHGTIAKNPDKTTYHYGEDVELTATASAGWAFKNWTGDATGTANPVMVHIDGDKTVTANYEEITYTISGNAGVGGATIGFTGGVSVTADGSGNYSITVPYNWIGTVTPSKTGYNFTPDHRDYSNVLADDPGEDYTAAAITYTISGNAGVGGATIGFTGEVSVTADGSGNYSITVPYNWIGTVTPSKTGYNFTPDHRDYSNVLADDPGEDYTAAAITYTISGNAGVGGAAIGFTGGVSVTADGSGNYSITVPYDWSGTVTPSKTGYSFTPDHRDYSKVLADDPGEDYTASLVTYLLTVNKSGTGTGTVTSSPIGIDCGVTCTHSYNLNTVVTLTAAPAAGSTFTGWSDAGCPGTGTCQVTMDAAKGVTATFTAIEYTLSINSAHGTVVKNPEKATYHYGEDVELTATAGAGWTFMNWTGDATGTVNPVTVHIDGNKTVTANYEAITFTISGNAELEGVTIAFDGSTPVLTDINGDYSITVPYNWSGTVTPALAGYTFTPAYRDYDGVLENKIDQNFTTSSITFTISGNAGIAGATISFTGGTPVTADGSGNYSITVPYNWTGTVTPSLAGYAFTPDHRSYTNVKADDPGENYTAAAITYTISGSAGVGGATISFTGGTPVTADGSGNYTFTVPYNWSGTVTPSKTEYTFSPLDRNYSNVKADQLNQDFTATKNKYLLTINKTGTGTGVVTSTPTGISCGADCTENFEYGTIVTLNATPTSSYHRFLGWSGGGCSGKGSCQVTISAAATVSAAFEISTFADVPFDYERWAYIEALWDNGLTAGCTTSGPLMYCPEQVMLREESAVFMLRAEYGTAYVPPVPTGSVFVDMIDTTYWSTKWAEGMWEEDMTAGCQYPATDPLKFCPWTQFTREQGSVFALSMKYGTSYVPPAASGTVFADMTDPTYWGTKWAEQAYADGLIPACGEDPGTLKPLFCPTNQMDRSWSAYIIVMAKGLTLPD
jgi:uncharacterized repeat protein (TIGR02543 family)